jgi:hypothetical protein
MPAERARTAAAPTDRAFAVRPFSRDAADPMDFERGSALESLIIITGGMEACPRILAMFAIDCG